MQQATTRASQKTSPRKMNTHFSLKGKPRSDDADQEKRLPATTGETALAKIKI